ncbi:DOT1-domain-containing protein [Mycena galericulata]|nr:DOT1-domain-containing protein [Mycena galericulata]
MSKVAENLYHPLDDLLQTLHTIIRHYLTPLQRTLITGSVHPHPGASFNYLQSLELAYDTHDGPAFQSNFGRINDILKTLKYPSPPISNSLMNIICTWNSAGIPKDVVLRISEESYSRSVSPQAGDLNIYPPASNLVFGELRPSLIYHIIRLAGLTQESTFVDLGSGVGNVVSQASLQTGCRSFGVELNDNPARLATDLHVEFQQRCKMWGVRPGQIELEHGDMLKSTQLTALLPDADLILVNNLRFDDHLNRDILMKLERMKEGAYVVSLVPFGTSVHANISHRSVRDLVQVADLVPFCVTEHDYPPDSVSWGPNGGTFFLHRVAHAEYRKILRRHEVELDELEMKEGEGEGLDDRRSRTAP